MEDIDPITGLPKELGIWEDIAKEGQDITIKIVKKKFGKEYTIIDGLDGKRIDLKDLNKKLKSKFACGGTIKENRIELQGEHKPRVKQILIESGFAPETIVVK